MVSFYKKGAAVLGALTVLVGIVAASVVANSGTFTNLTSTNATTTSLVIGGGTAVNKIVSKTTSFNANSIGVGQSTTTDITLTGAVTGDACAVTVTAGDLWSTTSTAVFSCRVISADLGQILIYNATGTSAFDAGMSTVRVTAMSF